MRSILAELNSPTAWAVRGRTAVLIVAVVAIIVAVDLVTGRDVSRYVWAIAAVWYFTECHRLKLKEDDGR